MQVVLDEVGRARFAEFVAAGDVPPAAVSLRPAGGLAKLAEALPGGMVDCSVGTPCDPPPGGRGGAGLLGRRAGVPAVGREPASAPGRGAWLAPPLRAGEVPASVAACVGTKELVASVPHVLRLRQPEQGHRAVPGRVVPDLRHGRHPGRLPGRRRAGTGRAGRRARPRGHRRRTTPGGRCSCGPTRRPTRPEGWATSGPRRPGAGPTACRCSPTSATPSSPGPVRRAPMLEHGTDGVVAVHSLSKRSNLAGVRVGFYAGDAELVEFLRAVRQHAGLMVPGPAQAAGVAALGDDAHVEEQRARYRERLEFLAGVLTATAARPPSPRAASTCGCPCRKDRWTDAWAMAEALARTVGSWSAPVTSTARRRGSRARRRGPADGALELVGERPPSPRDDVDRDRSWSGPRCRSGVGRVQHG